MADGRSCLHCLVFLLVLVQRTVSINRDTQSLIANLETDKVGSSQESLSKLEIQAEFREAVFIQHGMIPRDGHPFVVGPENTGTNFMSKLCDTNGLDVGYTPYGSTSNVPWVKAMGWKHMPVEWAPAHTLKPENKRINIVMARHPLSWILSNRKTKYSYSCDETPFAASNSLLQVNKTFEAEENEQQEDPPKWWKDLEWKNFCSCEFVLDKNACRSNTNPSPVCNQVDDPTQPRIYFNNLIEIWNMYYKGYLESEIPTIVVRYEDLLVDPKHIVDMLADAIGKPLTSFISVTDPAKESYNEHSRHSARSFNEAAQFNLPKKYMKYFNEDIMEHVKTAIDHDVLTKLGYSL